MMTSRERLLATIKCQPTDRVPISAYGMHPYVLHAPYEHRSYYNLLKVLEEKTDTVALWYPKSNETVFGSSKLVDMDTKITREGKDTITKKTLHTPKGDLTHVSKESDDIATVWTIKHWCEDLDDIEKVLSIEYIPLEYDVSEYQSIEDQIDDNGIIMASISDPMLMAADLMDFGNFTIWACMEPDHFERIVSIMHERTMENLRQLLKVNVTDLYRIYGPEYATPPYLPPASFERFVLPYVSEMTKIIHEKGSLVRIHSHGKIGKVLDMIIETGADSIDPCEAPPDGDISLAEAKRRCINKMSIFGNLQLKLLEHSTPDEVCNAVISCMNEAKQGYGYAIMPTAEPINIPLSKKTEENYYTFIETALKYGMY